MRGVVQSAVGCAALLAVSGNAEWSNRRVPVTSDNSTDDFNLPPEDTKTKFFDETEDFFSGPCEPRYHQLFQIAIPRVNRDASSVIGGGRFNATCYEVQQDDDQGTRPAVPYRMRVNRLKCLASFVDGQWVEAADAGVGNCGQDGVWDDVIGEVSDDRGPPLCDSEGDDSLSQEPNPFVAYALGKVYAGCRSAECVEQDEVNMILPPQDDPNAATCGCWVKDETVDYVGVPVTPEPEYPDVTRPDDNRPPNRPGRPGPPGGGGRPDPREEDDEEGNDDDQGGNNEGNDDDQGGNNEGPINEEGPREDDDQGGNNEGPINEEGPKEDDEGGNNDDENGGNNVGPGVRRGRRDGPLSEGDFGEEEDALRGGVTFVRVGSSYFKPCDYRAQGFSGFVEMKCVYNRAKQAAHFVPKNRCVTADIGTTLSDMSDAIRDVPNLTNYSFGGYARYLNMMASVLGNRDSFREDAAGANLDFVENATNTITEQQVNDFEDLASDSVRTGRRANVEGSVEEDEVTDLLASVFSQDLLTARNETGVPPLGRRGKRVAWEAAGLFLDSVRNQNRTMVEWNVPGAIIRTKRKWSNGDTFQAVNGSSVVNVRRASTLSDTIADRMDAYLIEFDREIFSDVRFSAFAAALRNRVRLSRSILEIGVSRVDDEGNTTKVDIQDTTLIESGGNVEFTIDVEDVEPDAEITCVYQNETTNEWEQNGVEFVGKTYDAEMRTARVTCRSYHTTSFAIVSVEPESSSSSSSTAVFPGEPTSSASTTPTPSSDSSSDEDLSDDLFVVSAAVNVHMHVSLVLGISILAAAITL